MKCKHIVGGMYNNIAGATTITGSDPGEPKASMLSQSSFWLFIALAALGSPHPLFHEADSPLQPLRAKVIISDVDVMWLRDPMPFFLRYPDADILTSSDHLMSTVGKEEQLEKYPDSGSAFNIGT